MIQYQQQSPAQVRSQEKLLSGLEKAMTQSNEFAVEQQQYNRQKGRLAEAFSKIQPNQPFLEQLKSIAPDLLSTPGGAQALSELAPTLGQYAQNSAIRTALDSRRKPSGGAAEAAQSQMQQPSSPPQSIRNVPKSPEEGEAAYRSPQAPYSAENTFPERTAGPTTQKLMSPTEMHEKTLDLMDTSGQFGKPMDYGQAASIVQNQNTQIAASNAQIDQEKAAQLAAQRDFTKNMVQRAQEEGLVQANSPEDVAIAEKLSLQAKKAPSEVEAWGYVKSGLQEYKGARSKIQREYSRPDPFTGFWDKMMGNYKTKEETMKHIQPEIDTYKKYGLIPELREDLMQGPGFGPEDVEEAIFPLKGEALDQITAFPKNSKAVKKPGLPPGVQDITQIFPGTEYKLSPDEYPKFKDSVSNYLANNPGVNLVSVRARLNQDKRYAWQDFADVISELIKEKKFTPDRTQIDQKTIIDQGPIPGMGAMFRFGLKGTK